MGGWRPGTEYTYQYDGRLLTSIPELSSHHLSGIGIKSKLTLTVVRSGRIVLHIKDGEYARVNNVSLFSFEVQTRNALAHS